jgi:hypothetical protein
MKIYTKRGKETEIEHLLARLLNGIIIDPITECWEWQKTNNGQGYGTLTVNHKTVFAGRLLYEITNDKIPLDMMLCHTCDNPSCINPDHRFIGTQLDNMQDCARKGRTNTPIVSFPGELNPSAKIKTTDVAEIRKFLSYGITQLQIANNYGISQAQVSNIKRGAEWK